MVKDKDFKGYIHDVGGPTANFRAPSCEKQLKYGVCKEKQCLFPKPCKNMKVDHRDYVALLRKLRKIPGVKKVFIRSGIRFDYVMADKDDTFLKELCQYHISGQLKVAPEHVSDAVLEKMGKPENSVYKGFVKRYKKMNERLGMDQYLVPYLMSYHPGSTLKEAVELAEHLRDLGYMPEQVQDFYPTPSTISTCMYYTGVDPRNMKNIPLVSDAVDKLRASYYFMGALLGKYKEVTIRMPGGCYLGPRPIDLHLKGFEALGADINYDEETGTYHLKADELIGTEIYLDFASVGATINIMLAAVKAKGRTVIENAAKEPEIIDVANLLTKMGARIRGVGTDTITIDGVEHMHGAYHEIIPDRIEAGTFLIIAAAIGEKMVIQNIIPQHLDALISKLKEIGIKMEKIGDSIVVYGNDGNLKPVEVKTQIYPGFATDLQQPLTTLLTQGNGQSKVSETIYKERFKHCAQLNKMGADIELGEACAYIKGKTPLHGARVMATDLRCGAALVVAGLMAEGKTEITNVYHIDRGYDNIDHKLITLGAHITRYMIDD